MFLDLEFSSDIFVVLLTNGVVYAAGVNINNAVALLNGTQLFSDSLVFTAFAHDCIY
jgi:hypothetical protein